MVVALSCLHQVRLGKTSNFLLVKVIFGPKVHGIVGFLLQFFVVSTKRTDFCHRFLFNDEQHRVRVAIIQPIRALNLKRHWFYRHKHAA